MKISTFVVLIIAAGILFLQSTPIPQNQEQTTGSYPATVKKVINNKCYGCHSVNGKSDKAKKALMWDSLPDLERGKLISSLNDIVEVLEKGEMPPEEVVKKYPQMKLLTEESEILTFWAEAKADSLLN
ncbi:MAG TPA: hypothetical protein VHO46_12885 [Bacteroidales bacterium]|nr:hypothetical protein [Bacteroidales bacterium]